MPSFISPGPGRLVDRDPEQFWYRLPEALIEVEAATGRLTYANRMAEVLLGYSAEEFAEGMGAKSLVTEETYQMIIERAVSLAGTVENPAPGYQRTDTQDVVETVMVRKDGSRFEAEGQGSFVLSENGTPVGMRLIFREITARKRNERTVAGSAQILELIVAGNPVDEVLSEICLILEGIERGGRCAIALSPAVSGPGDSVAGPGLQSGLKARLHEINWPERFDATAPDEGSAKSCCASSGPGGQPDDQLTELCRAGFGHFRALPIHAGDGAIIGAVVLLFPEAHAPTAGTTSPRNRRPAWPAWPSNATGTLNPFGAVNAAIERSQSGRAT